MPRLTWQNVSAPNFSPVTDALRTSSGLFSSAFSGLKDALNEFDAGKDEQANRAFQMELLKYQDPEAYKAALQSGAVYSGINTDRLSADSIAAAGARTGDLLDEAYKGVTIDTNRFNLSEDKDAVERSKAWAPVLAKARAMGDEEQAASYIASEGARLGMRAEEIDEGFDSVFGGAKDRSSLASDRQNRLLDLNRESRQQTNFDRDTLAYNERRQAERVLADVTARSGGDSALAFQLLQESGLTGNAYNMVEQQLGGGRAAPGGGGGSSSALVGKPTGITSGRFEDVVARLWGTEGGYVDDPDDPGGKTNFGITEAVARENGYTGDMKNIPRALAERIYRDKYWKPVVDAGVPEQYREAVFDFAVNAGPRRALEFWESTGNIEDFNARRIEHYKDQPGWSKYGRGWMARVAKTTPAPAYSEGEARIANAAQREIDAVRQQELNDPVISFYRDPKNRGFSGDSANVVSQIRRSSWAGTVEGLSDKALAKALDTIVSRAKAKGITMTPAQAAGFLRAEDVIRSSKLIDYVPGSGVASSDLSLGGGRVLETSAIDTELEKLTNGDNVKIAAERERIRVTADERRAAQKSVQRAQQALTSAIARGLERRNPGHVQQLREQLEQAQRVARTLDTRS